MPHVQAALEVGKGFRVAAAHEVTQRVAAGHGEEARTVANGGAAVGLDEVDLVGTFGRVVEVEKDALHAESLRLAAAETGRGSRPTREGSRRMSQPEHNCGGEAPAVNPFKLECVIVCDRYSDFLQMTLPHNKILFDRVVVVTSYEDTATRRICEYNHVQCVPTDVLESRKGSFCKGAGINAGLAELELDGAVLHLDADMYLPPQTKILLGMAGLDQTMIYGIDRFNRSRMGDLAGVCRAAAPAARRRDVDPHDVGLSCRHAGHASAPGRIHADRLLPALVSAGQRCAAVRGRPHRCRTRRHHVCWPVATQPARLHSGDRRLSPGERRRRAWIELEGAQDAALQLQEGPGMKEVATFDPDEIRNVCRQNLAQGLRAIADALDAGELEGKLLEVRGNGFVSWRDTRAHVVVAIDLAAQVFEWRDGQQIALPPRDPIALPADLQLLLERGEAI